MKSKIIIALLFLSLIASAEQLTITLIIDMPTATNYAVVKAINTNKSIVIKPSLSSPSISILETQIKLEEKRIKEKYDGLPTKYAANSSDVSTATLNTVISSWKEHDKEIAELNKKKELLKRMKGQ